MAQKQCGDGSRVGEGMIVAMVVLVMMVPTLLHTHLANRSIHTRMEHRQS